MATGTIQQVTNNSGTKYCKMPDGTLLCWDYLTKDVTADDWLTWSGTNLYYIEIEPNITWAVPFKSEPYTFGHLYQGVGFTSKIYANAAGCTNKIEIYRPTKAAARYAISILAIGRWK